ncbi:hypothetical protein TDB9533_03338 [Thalassocella blandensis]|nr:hypothetical protein TDB9533_03338 [Thalassocella blandensis]
MLEAANHIGRFTLAFALMIPCLCGALIVFPFSYTFSRTLIRGANRAFLFVFGIRVEIEVGNNPEHQNQGGIIVGLTQQSLLDPTIGFASWTKPVKAIWNFEYSLIPFVGWISFILGWVIVRQSPTQAKNQLGKAAKYAARGGLVYLSAEGQRSMDGKLCSYKKGPLVMAISAQVPIYPVYITGSRACMKAGSWKIKPGTVTVRYLTPISTKGMTYEDRNSLVKTLRAVGKLAHRKWH